MSTESLYWYGSIFAWMFFTGLGLPPVPEEGAMLYPAGLAAEHPEVRWWLAMLATVLGILCADMVLYAIGRFAGRRLLRIRWLQRIIPPEREARIESGFHRHGAKIIVTARLLPPLRTSVFITAGLIRYPFARYVLVDGICAVIATFLVFGIWHSLWGTIKWLIQEGLHRWEAWLLATIVLAAAGYAIFRYLRFVRSRSEQPTIEPPKLQELLPHGHVDHAPPHTERPHAEERAGKPEANGKGTS